MKLNGYRASHRNRWLLIKSKVLTPQEFLLFEYYLDSMDFDSRHSNFGLFEAFLNEIALDFDKKEDTIQDWHNSLLEKGFIQLVDKKRKLFKVKTPERYGTVLGCNAKEFAKNEKNTPTLDFILQNVCFSPEKAKINPPNNTTLASDNTSKYLGSSKGGLGLSSIGSKKVVVISQSVRSGTEYQKMYQESGCEGLTPDEMKWVDQNVTEKIVIENNEQENDIVNTFFDGDWNEYQKHLKVSDDFPYQLAKSNLTSEGGGKS